MTESPLPLREAVLQALEAGPLSPVELLDRVKESMPPSLAPRRRYLPPPHPIEVLSAELLRMALDEDLVHARGGRWHLGRRSG